MSHSKTLQNSHQSQRDSGWFIRASPVRSRSASQQTDQNASDALVVDVIDTSLRPFVVQDSWRNQLLYEVIDSSMVPIIKKNPLPSYQPAVTAPRRATGRLLSEGCLNCSRPLVCYCIQRQLSIKWQCPDAGGKVGTYSMSQGEDTMGDGARQQKWVGFGKSGCHFQRFRFDSGRRMQLRSMLEVSVEYQRSCFTEASAALGFPHYQRCGSASSS